MVSYERVSGAVTARFLGTRKGGGGGREYLAKRAREVGHLANGMLNMDVLVSIAECSLAAAFKMAMVCNEWRDAVEDSKHATAWRALVTLKETSLMGELVSLLRLSSAKVKEAEYRKKRRWGGGHFNIFDRDAVIALFRNRGGFDGLESRLLKYQQRRKTSRVDSDSVYTT